MADPRDVGRLGEALFRDNDHTKPFTCIESFDRLWSSFSQHGPIGEVGTRDGGFIYDSKTKMLIERDILFFSRLKIGGQTRPIHSGYHMPQQSSSMTFSLKLRLYSKRL